MQYGVELFPYQRIKKLSKGNNTEKNLGVAFFLKMFLYFFSSILITRVIMIDNTAPFGIALLIAIINQKDKKNSIIASCGVLIGYLTLFNNIKLFSLYIVITLSLLVVSFTVKHCTKLQTLILMLLAVFLEFGFYQLYFNNGTIMLSIFLAIFQICIILAIYFVLNFALNSIKDIRGRHLFTNEELISMGVALSLVISGSWGLSIFALSLRNILALTVVIIISYVNGSAVGAACGTAMGIIAGMSTKNMMVYISLYSICGLIPGIFREMSKWISALAYVIVAFILVAYSNTISDFKLLESIIASLIFILIPNKVYSNLTLEFNSDKKQTFVDDEYANKIKNILSKRLNNFSEVLYSIVNILNKLVDNEKLEIKTKSSALVENLANNVCSNCNTNTMCWKRELHYTYNAFAELIQNYQENRAVVPHEIERKCIKRSALIKNTEYIVNNHIISEMWKKRLSEGREMLSSQVENIAESVEEIISEFNTNIKFNHETDKKVRRILEKNLIKFEDVMCLNDKKDRIKIRILLKACGGRQLCVKQILPLLSEICNKNMCVGDEGCVIDKTNNNCSVNFEEVPKFHIATHVERACRDGEQYNGDSFSFEKLKDGTYMTIISDGMGYGPQAGKESSAVIELIQNLTNSGFSKNTAINTVNSIMTLKFSEDEKFSTVDLSSIDLYTGDLEFMKVGAVSSFIKNGENIQYIDSKTLPIGVLDKVDIEVTKLKVKNGDIVIMLSDGVLDYNKENAIRSDWVVEYLKELPNPTPKDVAEGIIHKAKELCNGKVKDDMTVVVSKIYNIF